MIQNRTIFLSCKQTYCSREQIKTNRNCSIYQSGTNDCSICIIFQSGPQA